MLTQAGELFRDHAERALRELEQGTQLLEDLNGAQRGRLTVGTLATAKSYSYRPAGIAIQTEDPGSSAAIPSTTLDTHRHWSPS